MRTLPSVDAAEGIQKKKIRQKVDQYTEKMIVSSKKGE